MLSITKVAGALFDGSEFTAQHNSIIRDCQRHVWLVEVELILGVGSKTWTVRKRWPDGTFMTLSTATTTAVTVRLTDAPIFTALTPDDRIEIITAGTTVEARARLIFDQGR
jgi:hypothetical protein